MDDAILPRLRRLLIADGRTRTRLALRALVAATGAFDVVGEASDAATVLAGVAALRPDVLLIAARLPPCRLAETVARLRALRPALRVVALCLTEGEGPLAVDGGADAAVLVGAPTGTLLDALDGREPRG